LKAGELSLIPATTLSCFEDAGHIHILTVLHLPTKRLSLQLSILTTATFNLLHFSHFAHSAFYILSAVWVITENSLSHL